MNGFMPSRVGARHGVENGQQFSHAGDERQFLRLAGSNESLLERRDDNVMFARHQRAHAQHRAYRRSSPLPKASPAHRARVATQWRDPREFRNRATRELSEFW